MKIPGFTLPTFGFALLLVFGLTPTTVLAQYPPVPGCEVTCVNGLYGQYCDYWDSEHPPAEECEENYGYDPHTCPQFQGSDYCNLCENIVWCGGGELSASALLETVAPSGSYLASQSATRLDGSLLQPCAGFLSGYTVDATASEVADDVDREPIHISL